MSVKNRIHQLVEWEAVGVAVMIGVRENPLIASTLGLVEGPDFCVVLAVQRSLTGCFILKQLHFILEPQTQEQENESGKK